MYSPKELAFHKYNELSKLYCNNCLVYKFVKYPIRYYTIIEQIYKKYNKICPNQCPMCSGKNLLHIAVIAKSKHAVEYFVGQKIGININDHLNMTPLHYAIKYYFPFAIKIFVKNGGEYCFYRNNANLFYPCIFLLLQNVKTKINHKIYLDLQEIIDYTPDNNDYTPLYYAIINNHVRAAYDLMDKGARISKLIVNNDKFKIINEYLWQKVKILYLLRNKENSNNQLHKYINMNIMCKGMFKYMVSHLIYQILINNYKYFY